MSTQLAFNFDAPRHWQEIILSTRLPSESERHEIIRFAQRSYKPEQYHQFARSTNCSLLFGDAWHSLCQRVRRYIALETEGDASCSCYDLSMGYDAQFYITTGLIKSQIAYFARQCYAFARAMHDVDVDGEEAPSLEKMVGRIEQINVKLASFEEEK